MKAVIPWWTDLSVWLPTEVESSGQLATHLVTQSEREGPVISQWGSWRNEVKSMKMHSYFFVFCCILYNRSKQIIADLVINLKVTTVARGDWGALVSCCPFSSDKWFERFVLHVGLKRIKSPLYWGGYQSSQRCNWLQDCWIALYCKVMPTKRGTQCEVLIFMNLHQTVADFNHTMIALPSSGHCLAPDSVQEKLQSGQQQGGVTSWDAGIKQHTDHRAASYLFIYSSILLIFCLVLSYWLFWCLPLYPICSLSLSLFPCQTIFVLVNDYKAANSVALFFFFFRVFTPWGSCAANI